MAPCGQYSSIDTNPASRWHLAQVVTDSVPVTLSILSTVVVERALQSDSLVFCFCFYLCFCFIIIIKALFVLLFFSVFYSTPPFIRVQLSWQVQFQAKSLWYGRRPKRNTSPRLKHNMRSAAHFPGHLSACFTFGSSFILHRSSTGRGWRRMDRFRVQGEGSRTKNKG